MAKEVTDKLYGVEDKEHSATNNTNEPSPKKHKPDAANDPIYTIDLTDDTDVGTIVSIINKSGYNMNIRSQVPPTQPTTSPPPTTFSSPTTSPLKRKFEELTTNPVTSPPRSTMSGSLTSGTSMPTFDEDSGKIKWAKCEECGKKREKNHHCRFFGQYKCGKCGHKWASAYAWKGNAITNREITS